MPLVEKVKDPAMGNLNYERKEGDYYPTPPWCTKALLKNYCFDDEVIWEPACGEGHMSTVLAEKHEVLSTDLHDRGYGLPFVDFLEQTEMYGGSTSIITNPPYLLAEDFIRHALTLTKETNGIVAMLLRNEFDCAVRRTDLFRHPAFAMKLVLTKRPRWIEGSTGSPRHNYAWFVWDLCNPDLPTIQWDQ